MGAYDAIVIGGGPGGSSTASFLAKSGARVLLLEKEVFPRFHIGESLLPYNRAIFDELGVWPKLEHAGFPKKYGAQFHIGNGSKSVGFVFGNGAFTRHHEAIQVERAKFDDILLRHAAELGAEVREGWTVSRFQEDDDRVAVSATGPGGETQTFEAKYLVDASGRGNLTGNQEGIRSVHPHLKKLALFGHFTGVLRPEGAKAGDTVIVRLETKWFWLIPISAERTSVGCVMDQSEFARAKQSPAALFEQAWHSSPVLSKRMGDAVAVGPIQTTSDFSYSNQRFVGKRLLRVGDAAGFMDPIFSAGVFLAMFTGKLAAQSILGCLPAGAPGGTRFAAYEKRVRRSMSFYWEMVHQFYTTPFLEVFFEPREKFMMASAVNAALAGELGGGWSLRWRMRLFFWVIRLQSRLKFLPAIRFNNPEPEA